MTIPEIMLARAAGQIKDPECRRRLIALGVSPSESDARMREQDGDLQPDVATSPRRSPDPSAPSDQPDSR